jgi:hypothetical protein
MLYYTGGPFAEVAANLLKISLYGLPQPAI